MLKKPRLTRLKRLEKRKNTLIRFKTTLSLPSFRLRQKNTFSWPGDTLFVVESLI